jgi:CrcB protein
MLLKVFGLAAAGALGTLCRVGLVALVSNWLPKFPWGTLVVNVLGCFFFGLVWSLGFGQRLVSADLRLWVLGGFMGAFTTYSTYVFDTVQLGQNLGLRAAAAYFVAQNMAGVGALYIGIIIGRSP